jgi:hypothetical protein
MGLLEVVNDVDIRRKVWHDAVQYMVKEGTLPHGAQPQDAIPSGCATVASHYLVRAGLIAPEGIRMSCGGLSQVLGGRGWRRVEEPDEVRPGDVVFTLDRGGLRGPDHVFIALDVPKADGARTVLVVDNQVQGEPHPRNLLAGRKTPMDFAVRPPAAEGELEAERVKDGLRRIFESLARIYQDYTALPPSAKQLLNQFAHHPVFEQFREQDV